MTDAVVGFDAAVEVYFAGMKPLCLAIDRAAEQALGMEPFALSVRLWRIARIV